MCYSLERSAFRSRQQPLKDAIPCRYGTAEASRQRHGTSSLVSFDPCPLQRCVKAQLASGTMRDTKLWSPLIDSSAPLSLGQVGPPASAQGRPALLHLPGSRASYWRRFREYSANGYLGAHQISSSIQLCPAFEQASSSAVTLWLWGIIRRGLYLPHSTHTRTVMHMLLG